MSAIFTGTDPAELRRVLHDGIDHGGNPIEPFTDDAGGWPLRCCLSDSLPGERIAIIAWAPMPWSGAYAETGPIVVHAEGCGSADPMPDCRPTSMHVRWCCARTAPTDASPTTECATCPPAAR